MKIIQCFSSVILLFTVFINVIVNNTITVTNDATLPATCNNLTIYSLPSSNAGSLEILPGKVLIVNGNLLHDISQ